ncbi:hypothetical protein PQR53_25650 [Paraburkholderia fungorum]|uniref:hypothetical protein n=1 Tax=Paraburkholderia fungorum TaxID=134537 RepID=UPI0038BB9E9F
MAYLLIEGPVTNAASLKIDLGENPCHPAISGNDRVSKLSAIFASDQRAVSARRAEN